MSSSLCAGTYGAPHIAQDPHDSAPTCSASAPNRPPADGRSKHVSRPTPISLSDLKLHRDTCLKSSKNPAARTLGAKLESIHAALENEHIDDAEHEALSFELMAFADILHGTRVSPVGEDAPQVVAEEENRFAHFGNLDDDDKAVLEKYGFEGMTLDANKLTYDEHSAVMDDLKVQRSAGRGILAMRGRRHQQARNADRERAQLRQAMPDPVSRTPPSHSIGSRHASAQGSSVSTSASARVPVRTQSLPLPNQNRSTLTRAAALPVPVPVRRQTAPLVTNASAHASTLPNSGTTLLPAPSPAQGVVRRLSEGGMRFAEKGIRAEHFTVDQIVARLEVADQNDIAHLEAVAAENANGTGPSVPPQLMQYLEKLIREKNGAEREKVYRWALSFHHINNRQDRRHLETVVAEQTDGSGPRIPESLMLYLEKIVRMHPFPDAVYLAALFAERHVNNRADTMHLADIAQKVCDGNGPRLVRTALEARINLIKREPYRYRNDGYLLAGVINKLDAAELKRVRDQALATFSSQRPYIRRS